jgi:outer membrane protein OmpA-like peptidoglycan-associated protein
MTASTDSNIPPQNQPTDTEATDTDFDTLRRLLLGADYQDLLRLKQQIENPTRHSASIAGVISEAISIRAQKDNSVAEALGPTIEGALNHSVKNNPKALADALYPVMGPAIRKSISETMNHLFESFNRALEQSLSPKALGWRLDAWRTGKQYSEIVLLKTMLYQVEQVFLIHKETGLLLHHLVSASAMSKDPDMVSAMLTAIQDFISDSFSISKEDRLSTLRLGDLTILVEQGPNAVIAAAVRGNVTTDYRSVLIESLESAHQQYNDEFTRYAGDNTPLVKLDSILQPCLKSVRQNEQAKRFPWLGVIALSILASVTGYWFYHQHQQQQHWQAIVNLFQKEPGIIVLQDTLSSDTADIIGLRDPLARPDQDILPALSIEGKAIQFQWRNYASMEPDIIFKRILQSLKPPQTIRLTFEDGNLIASGESDKKWLSNFKVMAPALLGVNSIEYNQVSTPDHSEQALRSLIQSINSTTITYDIAQTEPSDSDQAILDSLAAQISQASLFLDPVSQRLQIEITGHSDPSGSHELNQKISLRRAEAVVESLTQHGLSSSYFLIKNRLSETESIAADPNGVQRKISINAQLIQAPDVNRESQP